MDKKSEKNKLTFFKDLEEENSYKGDILRIIIFLNEKVKIEEVEDYVARIENKIKNYSKELFFEKEHTFGTLSIITNTLTLTCDNIYKRYKIRCSIEILFDAFKNILDADRTYMRGEKELESWFFVNHISLVVYYRVYSLLLESNILNKYCPKDIFLHLSQIKKIFINNEWIISEIPTKVNELIKKIGIPIT